MKHKKFNAVEHWEGLVTSLVNDALQAEGAMEKVKGDLDDGPKNNDVILIQLKDWRESNIISVNLLFKGKEDKFDLIGAAVTSGIWKGFNILNFEISGQANMRARMLRAAYLCLRELGHSVFYFEQE